MIRLLFLTLLSVFSIIPIQASEKPRVLYLGDTFSLGAFGATLDFNLRKNGAEVVTVVAGGSSPYYWLKAYQSLPSAIGYWEKTPSKERKVNHIHAVPKLEDLIDQHEPQFVVIQTGVKLYATLRSRRRPKSENVAEVRSLIKQMSLSVAKSGAKAYWILPPEIHERRYSPKLQFELASIMIESIREYGGAVFKSSQYTTYTNSYPATDGIQYSDRDATSWANRVSADLTVFIQDGSDSGTPVLVIDNQEEETVKYRSPRELTVVSASALPTITVPEPIRKREFVDQNPTQSEFDLDLRLLAKSAIENSSTIEYQNALGIFEYEVLKDRLGNYNGRRIRVAHGIVFRNRFTNAAKRAIGSTVSLKLVPLESYQAFKSWQTENDLPANPQMVIYTPKLD